MYLQLCTFSQSKAHLLPAMALLSTQQLRQGRPVQRDAVIAGGVDYGALMYGEHYDNKPEGATAQQPAVPKVCELLLRDLMACVHETKMLTFTTNPCMSTQGYAAALMAGGKATPE